LGFDEEAKSAEAKRVFECQGLKDRAGWLTILKFLESQRAAGLGKQRFSPKDIADKVPGKKLTEAYVRVAIRRSRVVLEDYYRLKETRDGEICFVIGRDAKRDQHGYYVDYEPYPGPYVGTPPDAIDVFWKQQIIGRIEDNGRRQATVYVIFSDENGPPSSIAAEENEATKSRRKKQSHAEPSPQKGLWAGSGEVMACYALGKIFADKGIDSEIVRSSAIGNRMREHDRVLVFVGSSLGMACLKHERGRTKLKFKQRYFFEKDQTSAKQDGQIEDVKKIHQPYRCETVDDNAYIDYALISYFYDDTINQAIVGLAGISTFATEQAVMNVTEVPRLLRLFDCIKAETGESIGPDQPLTEFEILIKVEVSSGAPGRDDEIQEFSSPEKLRSIAAVAR
jgi:hypothetical protein